MISGRTPAMGWGWGAGAHAGRAGCPLLVSCRSSVSVLIFMPLIHFDVIWVRSDMDLASVLCMCRASFPSTSPTVFLLLRIAFAILGLFQFCKNFGRVFSPSFVKNVEISSGLVLNLFSNLFLSEFTIGV